MIRPACFQHLIWKCRLSIFGGSLMSGCLLSIFLGVFLGPIMKFTEPYMNGRLVLVWGNLRGESPSLVARWSMQRHSSQRHCSQYIIKITTIVAWKNILFFVIIKYFCRWIWNLWFTVSRNRFAHVYVTVRRITGWHRCLLRPHGYIRWRGFKYWTWILSIWSISLYLGTCSHIHLVGFTHDALRRSSITCCYFISSSAWVFMKISGAAAKHTQITGHRGLP